MNLELPVVLDVVDRVNIRFYEVEKDESSNKTRDHHSDVLLPAKFTSLEHNSNSRPQGDLLVRQLQGLDVDEKTIFGIHDSAALKYWLECLLHTATIQVTAASQPTSRSIPGNHGHKSSESYNHYYEEENSLARIKCLYLRLKKGQYACSALIE